VKYDVKHPRFIVGDLILHDCMEEPGRVVQVLNYYSADNKFRGQKLNVEAPDRLTTWQVYSWDHSIILCQRPIDWIIPVEPPPPPSTFIDLLEKL